ncbi:unnamed protein product [Rhodiola kirilowii]
MNENSTPGPDGFTGRFHKTCWDIIKSDLMAAIDLYFHDFPLPVSFTATMLMLIPKVASATNMSQLRPISLCNFCHKIISRLLSSRLSGLLPRLISEEQVGFVQGRCIHENVCLAHDLAHDLNNKIFGGNVIIKLDMAKAYSVKWDGKMYAFFHSRRGVRQGDPLLPTLFVLAMELLSKALKNAIGTGTLPKYYTAPHALAINHLLFADDLLIFTNGA